MVVDDRRSDPVELCDAMRPDQAYLSALLTRDQKEKEKERIASLLRVLVYWNRFHDQLSIQSIDVLFVPASIMNSACRLQGMSEMREKSNASQAQVCVKASSLFRHAVSRRLDAFLHGSSISLADPPHCFCVASFPGLCNQRCHPEKCRAALMGCLYL